MQVKLRVLIWGLFALVFLAACGGSSPANVTPALGEVASGAREVTPPATTVAQQASVTPQAPGETSPAPSTSTPPTPTPTATVTPSPVATTPPVTATPGPSVTPPPATATPTPSATAPPATATPTPTSPATAPPVTATPTPTPTPPTPGGVFVRSQRTFVENDALYVVGELVNALNWPVFGATVIGSFYDRDGNLVGTGQAQASLPRMDPGQSDPFKMRIQPAPGEVERYDLRVAWEEVSVLEFRDLTVVNAEVQDGGAQAVVGVLRNDNETAVTSITVTATFYDPTGDVVNVYDVFLGAETLAPGAEIPFRIPVPAPDLVYGSFDVQAQGNLALF